LRRLAIFDVMPDHFTGRNLMKHTMIGAIFVAVTALLLSGCFGSTEEQKAKAQQESSDRLWDIPPPKTPDKGFKP